MLNLPLFMLLLSKICMSVKDGIVEVAIRKVLFLFIILVLHVLISLMVACQECSYGFLDHIVEQNCLLTCVFAWNQHRHLFRYDSNITRGIIYSWHVEVKLGYVFFACGVNNIYTGHLQPIW